MQLNIKNEEAYQLAREVSKQTGESLTSTVIAALREYRDRITPPQDDRASVEEVLAYVAAERPAGGWKFWTDDDMYDEWGLPK